jgi:hypothetical protein
MSSESPWRRIVARLAWKTMQRAFILAPSVFVGCASSLQAQQAQPPPAPPELAAPSPPLPPAAPGESEEITVRVHAPAPIVADVASEPARYFSEVADLGEVHLIDKHGDEEDIYVSSDFLDGAIHFYCVVRFRFERTAWGARLQGHSVEGNIGEVSVDGLVAGAGDESVYRARITVDPILPIPSRVLHRALALVVQRTAGIVIRQSESRAGRRVR